MEKQIPIPGGVPLPAAILDQNENPSSPKGAVLDRIASDFVDDVSSQPQTLNSQGTSGASPGPSQETDTEAWWAARDRADELYRALYGNEQANETSRQAYMEVLYGIAQ